MSDRPLSDYNWDSSGQITSTGSANAYVIATAAAITGYYQGMPPIRFKANFTNTGSATAEVNGLGAVTLKKGGGATNLAAGDIVSGGVYTLSHDGTNFQVLELNSPAVTSVGGFPLSASGDRWGVLTPVGTDGVMEIGRYLDWHTTDADTDDFDGRMEFDGSQFVFSHQLFVNRQGAGEGGEIKLQIPASGTTLAGDVIFDVAGNSVRFFENGGSFRGASIDLTLCAGGAATNLLGAIFRGTPQATTSGTDIDFTGIPSGVNRITVVFNGVSLSGTDNLLVQLGDSGGIENTGYVSTSGQTVSGASGDVNNSTAGFIINMGNAARLFSGHMVLTRIDGNTWIASHSGKAETTRAVSGGGDKTLSATLDRVRITRSGTNTFDAGSANIFYEF
jgi:hypothetical protein